MRHSIHILLLATAALMAMGTAIAQDSPPQDRREMSAEERDAARQARRELWENMSEEDRAAAREQHRAKREDRRAANRERYENMSEEERAAAREQRRARTEERHAARRERYESMSEEERQAMRERRAERGGQHRGNKGHGQRGKPPASSGDQG